MATDNYFIADQFSLLGKLMDIHGENSFKTKSYSSAAFTIEKLPQQLSEIPQDKIFSIRGIGDAIGKKILEILETGHLHLLQEYIDKTPKGVMDMLNIKGIGPKKIATIWKEMEIESLGELLYACEENRLMLFKGFGEKTQQNVRDAIVFYFSNQGSHLYAEIEQFVTHLTEKIQSAFPDALLQVTGAFRRQLEIIEKPEWVTTISRDDLAGFFSQHDAKPELEDATSITFNAEGKILIRFHLATKENFYFTLFNTCCSEEFMTTWKEKTKLNGTTVFSSEEEIFSLAKVYYLPPCLRESEYWIEKAQASAIPALIQPNDIRAIIHSHSNWSDGSNTIDEMAKACIAQGLEYLVISDHSKSAFYANGLQEERIREQHVYVEELNKKLAPFKIFKSIECDILNDGNLDYTHPILSTFDLVIASVHSNLKMTEEKAMMRLLNAIRNPYTTILGHMTGRLLLSRPGYPVQHDQIIDACVENDVVIELNAHPRRLDMDWRWIRKALDKGVLISIDPDAHSVEGYADNKYGVLAAQKGGLTKEKNLSSFTLAEFEAFLLARKRKKQIN